MGPARPRRRSGRPSQVTHGWWPARRILHRSVDLAPAFRCPASSDSRRNAPVHSNTRSMPSSDHGSSAGLRHAIHRNPLTVEHQSVVIDGHRPGRCHTAVFARCLGTGQRDKIHVQLDNSRSVPAYAYARRNGLRRFLRL